MVTESNKVVEGRNKSGQFLPGHPDFVSGTGAKLGRHKTLKTEVRDALKIAEDAMPALIKDMIRDAQDPAVSVAVRQQCREYLCDRIYGRPNQPLSGVGKASLITFIIGRGYEDVQRQRASEGSS